MIFDDDETITETETGDKLVGHQTFEYIVQVVYNLMVIIHKLTMDKMNYIDLDAFTSLIISPRTGHPYKNSKSESIDISLKIAEKAGAIERMNTLVCFDGTKNMTYRNGRYTEVMLWQDARNFVTKSGYEKTQKTQGNALVRTNIVSNTTMVTAEKRKGVMKTKVASLSPVSSQRPVDTDLT